MIVVYVVVASAAIWYGIDSFLGATDGFAARVDIRGAARVEDEASGHPGGVFEPALLAHVAQRRARGDDAGAGQGGAGGAGRAGADEVGEIAEAEEPAEGGEVAVPGDGDTSGGIGEPAEAESPTAPGALVGVAEPERNDSDADTVTVNEAGETIVLVAAASADETALVERIDPLLLRGPPPTRALDLTLSGCTLAAADEGASPYVRPDRTVGVLFRYGSVAIKGRSLSTLDTVVDAFRECASGLLVVKHNPQGRADVDGDRRLMTRRGEELKYYLLQRRVPAERMRIAEPS